MIASPKLLCPECQHENEPERVYCHNCGGRLDRSAVIPTKEPRKDTHKRVSRMFDARRAKMRAAFNQTCKSILGAAGVAVIIQVAQPPDVPPPTKQLILISQVRTEMENAINRHQPAQIDLSEDQVNSYLVSALKTKKSALDKPMVEFNRAVVALREGVCAFTVQRSIFGYSFYTGGSYSITVNNGKLTAEPKGGSIGRMPIHPKLMQFMSIAFADVWKALDSESKLVRKFNALQFHDKHTALIAAAK